MKTNDAGRGGSRECIGFREMQVYRYGNLQQYDVPLEIPYHRESSFP
jgi:hypothetical protein